MFILKLNTSQRLTQRRLAFSALHSTGNRRQRQSRRYYYNISSSARALFYPWSGPLLAVRTRSGCSSSLWEVNPLSRPAPLLPLLWFHLFACTRAPTLVPLSWLISASPPPSPAPSLLGGDFFTLCTYACLCAVLLYSVPSRKLQPLHKSGKRGL